MKSAQLLACQAIFLGIIITGYVRAENVNSCNPNESPVNSDSTKLVKITPGTFNRDNNRLVEKVSWNDAINHCGKMTILMGLAMATPGTLVKAETFEKNATAGMVLIPADSFTMGDTFKEGGSGELPTHTVQVSALYMDKYEVTKALWDEVHTWAVMHDYSFDNGGMSKGLNHPVQTVNWWDVVKWCNARSEKEGRIPAYYTDPSLTKVYRTGQISVQNDWVKWNAGYRLATEAEWEKAARGSASGHRYTWSDVDMITHSQANYYSTNILSYDISMTRGYHPSYQMGGRPYTSPVGSFAPNGYGLYDMTGNVLEWCWDWYSSSYYSYSPVNNPRGPASGSGRVLRGGGWGVRAKYCRVADRTGERPDCANRSIGFRAVLPAGQP